MKRLRLTTKIFLGLILGIILEYTFGILKKIFG